MIPIRIDELDRHINEDIEITADRQYGGRLIGVHAGGITMVVNDNYTFSKKQFDLSAIKSAMVQGDEKPTPIQVLVDQPEILVQDKAPSPEPPEAEDGIDLTPATKVGIGSWRNKKNWGKK